MFIDNQYYAYLEEKSVPEHINCEAKFSLTDKEEFLTYLKNLEADFSMKNFKQVFTWYGKGLIDTPTKLYNFKIRKYR